MKAEVTELEKMILLGAVGDIERLRRGKAVPGVEGWYAIQDAKAAAKERLVRLRTARWTDQDTLTSAASMAITRAMKRLEARGLARRVSVDFAEERANYLRVTTKGLKYVKDLREASRICGRKKSAASAEIGAPTITASQKRKGSMKQSDEAESAVDG